MNNHRTSHLNKTLALSVSVAVAAVLALTSAANPAQGYEGPYYDSNHPAPEQVISCKTSKRKRTKDEIQDCKQLVKTFYEQLALGYYPEYGGDKDDFCKKWYAADMRTFMCEWLMAEEDKEDAKRSKPIYIEECKQLYAQGKVRRTCEQLLTDEEKTTARRSGEQQQDKLV